MSGLAPVVEKVVIVLVVSVTRTVNDVLVAVSATRVTETT